MVQSVKRWAIDGAPTEAQLSEVAALFRAGGIVLMPTDTIYGLHGVEQSARKIAEIKGRAEEKRFVMISASIAQLRSLGVDVPTTLEKIWPAPLTAIMRRGESTIAARIPNLVWLRDLLSRTGPLISTSANRSGEPPIASPADLPQQLLGRIDGLIDAGRLEGKASAIVDFTGTEPRFIRNGDPGFTQTLRKTLMKKL
jgi:tRNA threonylcarbamoyl adenosine modification protein (Sua5/YciO/YrdC/YwlC family)